jgi:hypothetical protein
MKKKKYILVGFIFFKMKNIIYRYEKEKKIQVHKQKEYKQVLTPKDPQNTTLTVTTTKNLHTQL